MSHGLSLAAVAREIAGFMPGWKFDETRGPDHASQIIEGPNGASLCFTSKRDKMEVSPCFINEDGCTYPSDGYKRVSSICLNPTRSPAVLAKDIENRLIQYYLPVYEEGRAKRQEWVDFESSRDAVVAALAKYLNEDRYKKGDTSISRYIRTQSEGGSDGVVLAEIRVNSTNSVDLKINSLHPNMVKKVLDLFGKLQVGDRQGRD